jgi:nitrogen fixation protein NifU and related proteins
MSRDADQHAPSGGTPARGSSAPPPQGEDMYREHILDHYKHPRNFGIVKSPSVDHEANNPLCGDQIRLTFLVDGANLVKDIKFTGRGCAISQASASLLTTRVKGKSLDDIKKIERDDIVAMLGIPISPVRLKCALLSLAVLREGVEIFEKKLPPSTHE